MKELAPRHIGFAAMLSFVAGSVDGVGVSVLGGLFVSFMSGNSTRFAVSLAHADIGKALVTLALIGSFVAGAGLGACVARWRQPAVLLAEAALLAGCASLGVIGQGTANGCLMALAMGVENATFMRDGRTRINLTFMTGALVQVGQGIAEALFGGPRWTWVRYLVLWLGLTAGAISGAALFGLYGLAALWLPAALAGAAGAALALRPPIR